MTPSSVTATLHGHVDMYSSLPYGTLPSMVLICLVLVNLVQCLDYVTLEPSCEP